MLLIRFGRRRRRCWLLDGLSCRGSSRDPDLLWKSATLRGFLENATREMRKRMTLFQPVTPKRPDLQI